MKKMVTRMLGGGVLIIAGHTSWAGAWSVSSGVTTCTALGETQTDTVILNPPAISAGVDIPVGTVIYQGRWIRGENTELVFSCKTPLLSTSLWLNVGWAMDVAPTQAANWTGSPFGKAVYETGIPGIGVAISRNSNSDSIITNSASYEYPKDLEVIVKGGEYTRYLQNRTLYVTLIKIGTIQPGIYSLDGTKLPTVSLSVVAPLYHQQKMTGLPVKTNIVKFGGQLTISAQTCSTRDVNVELGNYNIQEYFTRKGDTTPWSDASIIMTGCPTYYGFYNGNNNTLMFDSSKGQGIIATSVSNSIGVRLTPTTDVIDVANGIMSIDSTIASTASGVGIQLAWGLSSQTPTPFNFANEHTMLLPKDGSPTIRIPLSARYIQTDSDPKPGHANGKVVFTINYY